MSCANATSRRITLCVVVVAIVGGCMLWKSKKRWIQVELSCITHAPIYIHVVGTWWVMICKEQQRLRTKAIKDTNKVCAIESTHLASLDISILVGPAMYNLLFAVVVSLIQEEFIATMHTIVTKKQSFKIKKEEGWYSEEEMRNDLGWNQYQPYFLFLFVTCSTTILLLDLFSFWII